MGLGAAINLAICNVFVANLQHGAFYQGIYQGIYGVGGTVGPLIATSLVNKGLHWSTYYYLPLGIAVFSMGSCGWAFKGFEKDTPQHHNGQPTSTSRRARSRKIFTSKPTIFGGMFIFAYQGAEVAISGWIVSFLVSYRGGDLSKVGYVTSGFWGGITIGRFLLSYVGSLVGERIFVFVITAGTLVLQLLVWFVPSVIGDSIAVALAGVLLGPIYPAATVTFVRLIPKQMQVSSFSFIAGVGSSGGAFVPFLTGLLAQQAGTWVLHPICISLFVAMIGTWFLLSEKHRSTD
jgi:fucose permease